MTIEHKSAMDSGRSSLHHSWVETLERDQRRRWKQGERVQVEEYCRLHPKLTADAQALLDLIINEVVLRHEQGEEASLTEYQARFPHLAAELAIQFEVDHALRSLGDSELPNLPELPGYEILRLLGHGATGMVYLARHRQLKRLVALKMLRDPAFATVAEQARLRGDGEALARLQHPNIVQIFDVGEYDGRTYLALEYAEGGSLDGYLGGTPQPAWQAATLLETLARAVHAAHQAQIVHRDLKPANILLQKATDHGGQTDTIVRARSAETETGAPKPPHLLDPNLKSVPTDPPLVTQFIPKVADFGLAKTLPGGGVATNLLTLSKDVVGTPSYMPPEQARGEGKHAGPAADVYGLGAILYECLTGRPPFRAATLADTQKQVLYDDPVAPARLVRGVSRDLETICLKCLRKEPAQRYASAAALADDLHRYLDGQAIVARPVGWVGRGLKWVRRRPLVAGLAALLFFSLTGGLVSTTWLWRRAEGQREQAETTYRLSHETLNILGGLWAGFRPEDAEKVYQGYVKLVPHFRALAEQYPHMTKYAEDLGGTLCNLGDLANATNRLEDSLSWCNQAVATLEPIVQRHPTNARACQYLCNSHGARAATLARLGRRAEALKDWDRALVLDDGTRRMDISLKRTLTLAKLGRHAEATAAADMLTERNDLPDITCYHLARVFVLAATETATPQQVDSYCGRAVQLLRRAAAGRRGGSEELRKNGEFKVLLNRADFQKLLADLEVGVKPE